MMHHARPRPFSHGYVVRHAYLLITYYMCMTLFRTGCALNFWKKKTIGDERTYRRKSFRKLYWQVLQKVAFPGSCPLAKYFPLPSKKRESSGFASSIEEKRKHPGKQTAFAAEKNLMKAYPRSASNSVQNQVTWPSFIVCRKAPSIIWRNWSRTRGRNLYDYIFHLTRNAGINMPHLKEKLVDSDFISGKEEFSKERLVTLSFQ